jgi:hypothetical protein
LVGANPNSYKKNESVIKWNGNTVKGDERKGRWVKS